MNQNSLESGSLRAARSKRLSLVFLTRFSLKNPIAITLFYILIVLLGIVAILRMGRSILPPVAFPVVAITAPYPGAGPAEIERLVIEPLEDQDTLKRFTVRSGDGRLIPLGTIARITRESEPAVIQRENRERVVAVSANTLDGAPVGLVSGPLQRLLRDPNFLPAGARIEPRGDVAQFLDTVGKMMAALGLSVIAIYTILAILYGSYKLPLVIMLTVPLACVGAFGTLYALNVLHGVFPGVALFASQTLNLYSMLGIIMLVGLVAKNGILFVEFAERALRDGTDARDAMCDAAQRRFRPILMTTLAMIAGMLPLALGDTVGAEYRKALGSVVIGGLSSSLLAPRPLAKGVQTAVL